MNQFILRSGFVLVFSFCFSVAALADQPPLVLPTWLRSLIELQAKDIARHLPKEQAEVFLRGPSEFFHRVETGQARAVTSANYERFLEVVKVYAGESSKAVDGDLPLEDWVKVRPMYASLAADPGPSEAFHGHYRIFQATLRRMEGMFKVEKVSVLPEQNLRLLWGGLSDEYITLALKCFPQVPPDLDFFRQSLRTWEGSKRSRFAENCESKLHFVVHHLRELDQVEYASLYTDVVRLLVKSEMKTTSKMRQTILGLGDNSFNRSPEDAESARILLSHIHLSDVEGDDRKIIKLLRKLARSAPLTEEGKTAADLLEVHDVVEKIETK